MNPGTPIPGAAPAEVPLAQALPELAEALLLPFLQGGEEACLRFARSLDVVARRAEGLGVRGLRHLASLVVRWVEQRHAILGPDQREALEVWGHELAGFLLAPDERRPGARLLEIAGAWPGMPALPPQFVALVTERLALDARLIRRALPGEPSRQDVTAASVARQDGPEPAAAGPAGIQVARDELDILREAVDAIRRERMRPFAEGEEDARRIEVREDLLRLSKAAGYIGVEVLALLTEQLADEVLGPGGWRRDFGALDAILEALSRWMGDPSVHAHTLVRAWAGAAWGTMPGEEGEAVGGTPRPGLPPAQALREIEGALAAVRVGASRQVQAPVAPAGAEALSLRIPPDADPGVVGQLLQELPERVGELAQALAEMAVEDGEPRQQALIRAQRLAHSIKGSAHTVGVRAVATITHQLEDLLQLLGRDERSFPPEVLPALSSAADCLGEMSDFLLGRGIEPGETRALSDALNGWIHLQLEPERAARTVDSTATEGSEGAAGAAAVDDGPDEDARPEAPDSPSAIHAFAPALPPTDDWVRVPARLLGRLLDLSGEAALQLAQATEQADALARSRELVRLGADRLQGLAGEAEHLQFGAARTAAAAGPRPEGAFDALEMDRFDEFQMLSARLVEAGTDSRLADFQLERQLSSLSDHLGELERIQAETREAILQARTLPVASVVPRLQRAVRQAARMSGRDVAFDVIGQDTLVDGALLQQLVDPLTHLLRNAVDHGIETAGERVAAGKPPQGRVTLRIARSGARLVLDCSDDGRGLDGEAIRRCALERGLLELRGPGSENALTAADLARLIVLPGFSTRAHATQLSGRGMGLDVAAGVLRQLRGQLGVASVTGLGARFSLEVPELLATMPVAVARVGAAQSAMSMHGVEEIVAVESLRRDASGEELLSLGDGVVRVCRLGELLAPAAHVVEALPPNEPESVALLVRRLDGERVAVLIGALSQARPMVVRPLPSWLPSVPWLDGATVLGDGAVTGVIDLPRLLATETPGASRRRARPRPEAPRCLIVDDSVSVRRAMELFLRDLGLDVDACVDGVQALAMARARPPALAIVDLEMPRMDGLELARALRADPATSRLPIVMITSRFSERHRQRALEAGVDAFLSKPYDEDELAGWVRACLEDGRPLG